MSELKRPVSHWQPTTPSINDVLIDIIDKQLVVVPQIVADYIETQKDNIYDGIVEVIIDPQLYGEAVNRAEIEEIKF